MLRLSGVVHVVGGPDVLHGRVLAALLGPEERVLQHPARAAREAVGCAARNAHGQPRRCRRANCRRASQRSSNLARGGRQGCCSFCQAPRYPKAPPTPSAAKATSPSSAATAAVSSTACAAPRSTSCAHCPASQEALHVTGPAYDLRRRLRLARTGQHVQAHVLSRVLRQLRAEGCEPRGLCAYARRLQCCADGP